MRGSQEEAFPGKANAGMGGHDEEGEKASQGAVLSKVQWRKTIRPTFVWNKLP